MRKIYFLLTLLTPFSLFAQLDNTFDGDGRASVTMNTNAYGTALFIQPADQKIVVAGAFNAVNGIQFMGIARFLTNGSLDPQFGSGGKLLLPFPIATSSNVSIGMQSDGSIIMASEYSSSTAVRYVALIKMSSIGQIDYNFSPTGYLLLYTPAQFNTMLIQSDDKILIGGYTNISTGPCAVIARFTKDGVLDTGYGTGGVFSTTAAPEAYRMAFASDGSVVAYGAYNNSEVFHVTTLGKLDTQFGAGGFCKITVNGTDPVFISGIMVNSGGFIVLSGRYLPAVSNPLWRYLVVELTGDGKFNPAFAGNGKLAIPVPDYNAWDPTAVQLIEGQIVIAGSLHPTGTGPSQIGLSRITGNGAIDYSFGPNGVQITGWSNSSYNVLVDAIALQKDQKIVVGGSINNGSFAALRYLNPVILPPPPVVTTNATALQNAALTPGHAEVQLFPNPATQTVNIKGLDPSTVTRIQVTDIAGHTLLMAQANNQIVYLLDIHQLPAGTYYVTLLTENRRTTLSVVKIR
jgi:uncharacterized delta-60 repeat protein